MKRNIELLSTTREKLNRRKFDFNNIQTICSLVSLFSAGVVIGSILADNANSKIGVGLYTSALSTYITAEILDRRNEKKLRELNENN